MTLLPSHNAVDRGQSSLSLLFDKLLRCRIAVDRGRFVNRFQADPLHHPGLLFGERANFEVAEEVVVKRNVEAGREDRVITWMGSGDTKEAIRPGRPKPERRIPVVSPQASMYHKARSSKIRMGLARCSGSLGQRQKEKPRKNLEEHSYLV